MRRYPIIVMVLLCALTWTIVAALVLAIHSAAAQPPASLQYRAQITREAQFRFGIPAPVPAIAGQITQESGWNPLARSRVGASGLMQFMPATATWAAQASRTGPAETFNPAWSIRMGVWYDHWLYERIKAGTDCDRWMFALSSYNGGLGYVYKRQKLSTTPGSWPATGMLNPGITPANQVENQSYGPRILLRHQPQFASWGRTVCLSAP